MIIDEADNVVVAIYEIQADEQVDYTLKSGALESLTAIMQVPLFHKIARTDIAKGAFIIKYGEHIGIAAADIKKGEHVHVHNVADVDYDAKGVSL